MASVLIVEDNADLREMYAEILAMGGHVVSAAESALEALEALEALKPVRPDVAVLDLGIAGGVDMVVSALRAPPGARPVALILASGARDLAERAFALGAACLQKPFGPEQLLAEVDRALGG